MDRKTFLKTTAAAGLGTMAIPACTTEEVKQNGKPFTGREYKWKMVTTWAPNFPILGEGCNFFAQWVRDMSGGQLDIKVYGAGELIPALECFDAVSSGAAECASGASYYWAGKSEIAPFFTTVPFGMNAQQMNAWLYSGGGMDLWKELYARFGLVPMPGGNTGVQMAGWFNKEINTMADFKGLKMRIPGLGAKVLSRAGGTPVLSSGSEIYTNLERGVIDATEWIGPYHDYIMGFHKIAKYYYAPGWHETGSTLELFFNKKEFDSLPVHLQHIVESAAARFNIWVISAFEAQNNAYMQKLIQEEKADVRIFSKEILDTLRAYSREVLLELVEKDPFYKKVYQSYSTFLAQSQQWANYSEKLYYNNISL